MIEIQKEEDAQQTIASLLNHLWQHITPRRRGQFAIVLLLMITASFAEVVSIGAVIPFLAVLTAPERIFQLPLAKPFIEALGITTSAKLLLPLTFVFVIAAFVSGVMRLILLWASTRLSFATGADLSLNIYRRTLYQPYKVHVARNSSEVINGISYKANSVTGGIILPATSLISSSVMLITIIIALMFVDPITAILAFSGFGIIYLCILNITKKNQLKNSQSIAIESTQVIKSLQEGLGGIRDVLLNGCQEVYCQIYRDADNPFRRAQGSSIFIANSPRAGIEALGMMLIAGLAYSLAIQPDGIAKAIPVLGTMALGAQRLLPALQATYVAWSTILSNQTSLKDTLELLDQPLPDYNNPSVLKSIPFLRQISVKNVLYQYTGQSTFILKNVNFTITKGSRIGFIGVTGSGKSTLLDIIMGLLEPTDGSIIIDDEIITPKNQRAWQTHIAHVPQTIFLADSTIEENIAFGVTKKNINHQKVMQAAEEAQLADIIESWPKKYQTYIGERGIRLSGGQRQRIGIARALYKQADVLIFDEATNALDSETEEAVMRSIESLGKKLTIMIIAHRLTTLKNCDQIIELGEGGIKRFGSYQEIVNRNH